ncbi:MAG: PLP-dependent aspartate aminotransferase family protein [Planctomycetota bacterium]|nr:PLP-dependent aspartate aminotransferase family protein [Planctomycetota bacterium]
MSSSNSHHHRLQLGSLCIHGGQSPDPETGAVMPPISLSTTYAQKSPGVHQGYDYSRGTNPTRYAFERCLARLEGSSLTQDQDVTFGGFAFSSGLASIGAVLDLLDSGDHVIAMDDLYGGTGRLFTKIRERSSALSFSFVDMTNPQNILDAITEKTKLIWVETPTNPLLKVVDLKAIANLARERGILTACDNTFATPMLQRPIDFGFDITMHSITKYIGGHSDVLGGALVTNDAQLAERIRFLQFAGGAVLGPFDSYLALRGTKTLNVRMRQHCESGSAIATWLENHDKIERVVFPGLPSHPQYAIAQQQMRYKGEPTGGGMITIFLRGGIEESRCFLENVQIFALAESLGGVESLIEHPAIMTHASVPAERRAELGISDNLVRLSVGIEETDDLIADLEQALEAIVPKEAASIS